MGRFVDVVCYDLNGAPERVRAHKLVNLLVDESANPILILLYLIFLRVEKSITNALMLGLLFK